MFRVRLLFLFLLFVWTSLSAKKSNWESYFSYNNVQNVAVAKNKIFATSNGNLFYYNKIENTINTFQKKDGLSDVDISKIYFSKYSKKLIVLYSNLNIDIIDEYLNVKNIPFVKLKNILGEKSINNIFLHVTKTGEMAYISTDFGVLVLDINRCEIKDTYFFNQGININDFIELNNTFFVATSKGIYRAEALGQNLADPNLWVKIEDENVKDVIVNELETFKNNIICRVDDSLYKSVDGNIWENYDEYTSKYPAIKLQTIDNSLIIINKKFLSVINDSQTTINDNDINGVGYDGVSYWLADQNEGLKSLTKGRYKNYKLNSPRTSDVFNLDVGSDGVLWVCPNGYNKMWGETWKPSQVYKYSNHSWKTLSFGGTNVIDVAVDPKNPKHLFACTWLSKTGDTQNAIYEVYNNKIINRFNKNNSSVQNLISSNPDYMKRQVRISGLDFDNDGNLWAVNSNVDNPLLVKRGDDWDSFTFPNLSRNQTSDILVTSLNQVWINIGESHVDRGQIVIYDIASKEFRSLLLADEDGIHYGTKVRDFAEDKYSQIWVAFEGGVLVYRDPNAAFEKEIRGSKIYRDGESKFLLEDKKVTSVAIDGANRKWFGTERNGVFLVSDSGDKMIHHFTTENSPLPSNNIVDIAIDNHVSGKVYFGTTSGITSYQSDATAGKSNQHGVYAYPNPIKPNYTGKVAITNLVNESEVKITDLSGNLIYQAYSNGGTLVWDLHSLAGVRIVSGIYLVFCASKDGKQYGVAKIAVL